MTCGPLKTVPRLIEKVMIAFHRQRIRLASLISTPRSLGGDHEWMLVGLEDLVQIHVFPNVLSPCLSVGREDT